MVQASAPARLIEGDLPTERMIAKILVDKYADHVPLYRQVQGFERQGIKLDRSTLAFWTGYAAAELKPIWSHMRQILLGGSRLFVDETRAPMLDPGRGKTKTGYFWAIARDDRGWAGADPPAVVYTSAPGRGADHAISLLKDFSGVLQTDGYGAYKTLVPRRNDVVLAACWAHARRKFFDLAKGGTAPIADEILARIGQLYAVEADIRGQSADARRQARQARSAPLLETLRSVMDDKIRRLPGKSPTAEAIRYVQSRWTELSRFLDDGRIELDTNPVERAMRPIALNRKNALFAGSDEGAEHWATVATLIECCMCGWPPRCKALFVQISEQSAACMCSAYIRRHIRPPAKMTSADWVHIKLARSERLQHFWVSQSRLSTLASSFQSAPLQHHRRTPADFGDRYLSGPVVFLSCHDGPNDPCHLVGQSDRSKLYGLSIDKPAKPALAEARRHHPKLGHMASDRIDQSYALPRQQLVSPMNDPSSLLGGRFSRRRPHRWTGHSLTNGCSTGGIVLLARDVRFNVSSRKHPHLVTKITYLLSPIMRGAACFHAN